MLPADNGGNVNEKSSMLEQRLAIVRAVRRGDIEGALTDLREHFPDVLARDGGIMRLKLRCRRFVELVNTAAEAKRAFSAATSSSHRGADDADSMDVDDDAPAQAALRAALSYGRTLRADYKKEAAERQEVQTLLERTWSVIAYHFPVEAGGDVGRWAGQDARDTLAGEVNQAILGTSNPISTICNIPVLMCCLFPLSPRAHHHLVESQGFPRQPALECIYRRTSASLVQLGFLGAGAAVFADLQRELLEY